jgi:DNA-binding NtrC family response regulator
MHLSSPVIQPEVEAAMTSLEEVERKHILAVLRQAGGNRSQAARILGVDPKTLYNKLKAYGIAGR